LASIFTAEFGKTLYDAMKNNDWSSVAEAIVQPLTNMITSQLGGLGGFGGVIGGFLGAAIGDLFGGIFGGGKKKERGDSMTNPVYTSDINVERLLTELLNATKVNLARRAAQGFNGGTPLRNQTVLIGY
jgi:DnaJ-class molecular chaperone